MKQDINNLIEELTKVRPDELSKEGLKLFEYVNAIIDKNKELEEDNKTLNERNQYLVKYRTKLEKELYESNENYIPVSLVEKEIKELDKEYKDILSDYGNIDTDVVINIPNKNVRKYCNKIVEKITVLQELLEKRK